MTSAEEWPEDLDGLDDVEVGYEDAADEPDYFARVMYYVLDFPGLSRVAKDAYICLVRGLGWGVRRRKMTRVQLAAVMSISTDTLDRGIKELEAKGLVEVIRRRDTVTGNWCTSSYLLKDTKSSRMRARIVELETALGKATGKKAASSQVSTSPQNAARTDEDKTGGDEGHRSADCGMDVTCDDAASPQVSTSPQIAEPPVRKLRNRRSADCGQRRESFKEIEEEREKDTPTPPTPPTAPAAAAAPSGEEEERNSDLETLVTQVLAIREGWGRRSIIKALTHENVVDRSWPRVRLAMLTLAKDPQTQSPNRLTVDGPWWNLPLVESERRSSSIEWCGECSNAQNRRVEHPDTGQDLGPCLNCHYSQHPQRRAS